MVRIKIPARGEGRQWCVRGAFTCDSESPTVRCGICLIDFQYPHQKAKHLASVHGARIERRVDGEGNLLYQWQLAYRGVL